MLWGNEIDRHLRESLMNCLAGLARCALVCQNHVQ